MTIQDIYSYINDDEIPAISKRFEIKSVVDKYPYFQLAIFVYLKMLYAAKDKMFRAELQRLFIFVSDRKALFYYVLKEEYQTFFIQKGNKNNLGVSRTDILLNAFFETMDDDAIDLEIDNASTLKGSHSIVHTDYLTYLESKSGDDLIDQGVALKPMKYQSIIDNFINNAEENISTRFVLSDNDNYTANNNSEENISTEQLNEEMQDDLFFTETLAGIYIKQQKYERAYEIIKRLSLNYPEKNIYFVAQISFLEKLIENKKYKK